MQKMDGIWYMVYGNRSMFKTSGLKKVLSCLGISLLALMLVGCPEEPPEEVNPAGSITIANIPQRMENNDTYKVYVSLSDYSTDAQPHKAQGIVDKNGLDFRNGKATVTVNLYAPPTGAGENPDFDKHGDACSVTSNYFSVTISPDTVSTSEDIIVKAGMGFSAQKQSWDWESMMDLKQLGQQSQINAIFSRIIKCDKKDGEEGGEGTGITVND